MSPRDKSSAPNQAQLAPDQQLAGFALDSPKLVGSLVEL